METEYINRLVANFNKKTGSSLNYRDICNSFVLLEQEPKDKKHREILVNRYSNTYRSIFNEVLEGFNKEYKTSGKINKTDNLLQEFDGMMSQIYDTQFEKYLKAKENGYEFRYGSTKGNGQIDLEYDFKKVFNSATDLEIEFKKDKEFKESDILSRLENCNRTFDLTQYKIHTNNTDEPDGGFRELASSLKVARDQYKKMGFFSKLFAFKERKAINTAKKTIISITKGSKNDMPRLNSEEAEKLLQDALSGSKEFETLRESIEDPTNHKATTDFEKIREDYLKRNNAKDKAEELREKKVAVSQKQKQYDDFVEKYNLKGDSKEQQRKRHDEFEKYLQDPKAYDDAYKKKEEEKNKSVGELVDVPDELVGSYNPEREEREKIKEQLIKADDFTVAEADEMQAGK